MPLHELRKHPHDYTVLAIGIGFLVLAFALSSSREHWQRLITIGLSLYYFFWGIWHHTRQHTLSLGVVLEYGALSALVVFVLWFALSY